VVIYLSGARCKLLAYGPAYASATPLNPDGPQKMEKVN